MARDLFADDSWHSVSKRPRWTPGDARPFINRVEEIVRPEGYGVSLYGSVLRDGAGRDLDLLLTPSHPDALNVFDLALVYLPRLGLSEIRMPGYGHRRELGVLSWTWEDEIERAVDFAFWPIRGEL